MNTSFRVKFTIVCVCVNEIAVFSLMHLIQAVQTYFIKICSNFQISASILALIF